jgi:hypothetical protein
MKKRESAIRYLEDIFEDGEYLSHGIWVNAYKIELDNMNNFSKWLANNEWELNYTTGKWENLDSLHQHSMSELYQMFLKSREA